MVSRLLKSNVLVFGLGWVANATASGLNSLVNDFQVFTFPQAAITFGMYGTAVVFYICAPIWIAYCALSRYPDYYRRGLLSGWNVGMTANMVMGLSSILAGGLRIALRLWFVKGSTEEAAQDALILLLGLVAVIWVGAMMGVIGFVIVRFKSSTKRSLPNSMPGG